MMYGLPGSLIQFGVKRAKSKPGRKSAQAHFLEKQNDLFPVDLYTSKLTAAHQAALRADALGAAGDQATARFVPFIPADGTEAATHARMRALGKAIPSLPLNGEAGE